MFNNIKTFEKYKINIKHVVIPYSMDEIFKNTHKKQGIKHSKYTTLKNIKQQHVEIPWANKHVQ